MRLIYSHFYTPKYCLYSKPIKNLQGYGIECSFHFNGMEKIEDLNGSGNALDFGARIYDARLGRWLSVDNRFKEIPSEAPYVGIGNMPIKFYDPDGNKIICEDKNTQKEVLKAINSQALGKFDFNSKGELYLVTKRGDESRTLPFPPVAPTTLGAESPTPPDVDTY